MGHLYNIYIYVYKHKPVSLNLMRSLPGGRLDKRGAM